MKKLTYFLFSLHISVFGQSDSLKKCMVLNRVELVGTHQLFGGGIGFVAKGKTSIKNTKHFELYTGIAYQQSHQSEANNLLRQITGYNKDVGLYLITDFIFYPLKSKSLFTGIEPFLGITLLETKGSLSLPELNIQEDYFMKYTYVNYGITQTLGYQFGRISTSLTTMLSLKGIIDEGRNRPGDSDSKIFVGLTVSYQVFRRNNSK